MSEELQREDNPRHFVAQWAASCAEEEAKPLDDDFVAFLEERYGHPHGWMIEHHRAAGSSTCRFGPFASMREADDWWREVGRAERVNPVFIPLYRDVDWSR